MHVPRHAAVMYGYKKKRGKMERGIPRHIHETGFISGETRAVFNNIRVPLKQTNGREYSYGAKYGRGDRCVSLKKIRRLFSMNIFVIKTHAKRM